MSTTAIDEQRTAALQYANRIRAERAHLKKRWKVADPHDARRELRDLILVPSSDVLTWKVEDALGAIRWVGEAKIRRLMLARGIPLGKVIGALTDRQALAIADWLVGE